MIQYKNIINSILASFKRFPVPAIMTCALAGLVLFWGEAYPRHHATILSIHKVLVLGILWFIGLDIYRERIIRKAEHM